MPFHVLLGVLLGIELVTVVAPPPVLVPSTLTETLHVALVVPTLGDAGSVPPVSWMLLEPGTAVTVPPQVLTTLGDGATVRPLASASVKPTEVIGVELKLVA